MEIGLLILTMKEYLKDVMFLKGQECAACYLDAVESVQDENSSSLDTKNTQHLCPQSRQMESMVLVIRA